MSGLLVVLGAAVGAPARWWVDQWIQGRRDSVFPLGTLLINVSGSLLLGVILGIASRTEGAGWWVSLLGTGFCGGYTTFSTFGLETVQLLDDGAWRTALLNVGASVVVGLAAAFAWWALGAALV